MPPDPIIRCQPLPQHPTNGRHLLALALRTEPVSGRHFVQRWLQAEQMPRGIASITKDGLLGILTTPTLDTGWIVIILQRRVKDTFPCGCILIVTGAKYFPIGPWVRESTKSTKNLEIERSSQIARQLLSIHGPVSGGQTSRPPLELKSPPQLPLCKGTLTGSTHRVVLHFRFPITAQQAGALP